jgi:hypothetical protein
LRVVPVEIHALADRQTEQTAAQHFCRARQMGAALRNLAAAESPDDCQSRILRLRFLEHRALERGVFSETMKLRKRSRASCSAWAGLRLISSRSALRTTGLVSGCGGCPRKPSLTLLPGASGSVPAGSLSACDSPMPYE